MKIWRELLGYVKLLVIVVVITGMIRRIHVHGKTNSCDLTSLWGKLL